jgi:hypothetical protein
MMKAWFRLGHVWLLCIVPSLLCAESARPEQLGHKHRPLGSDRNRCKIQDVKTVAMWMLSGFCELPHHCSRKSGIS